MTIDENRFNDIKKPIADKIPNTENEKATSAFINNLSCRLMDIADSIEDSESLDICKDTLSYHTADNPDTGSHMDIHMPADGKSDNKLNTQINAMNTMLLKSKATNSCFVNENDGYKMIINALIERPDEITDWLQDSYQNDHAIVLTTSEVNDMVNSSQEEYNNLGYGFIKDNRGRIEAFESQTMTIVLRKNEYDKENPLGFNGLGFHVHTAYPGQRQNSLNNELCGINPIPDEDVMSIVKQTSYYKNTTDMNRTLLLMQTSPKVQIPSKASLYHDAHRDAVVICGPDYIDKIDGCNQYAQKRYFIQQEQKNSPKTFVFAALYTKDINDPDAKWSRKETLRYPDCAPENTAKFVNKMQKCVDKQLEKFETQRARKSAELNSITQNISEPQSSIDGTELK